MPSDLKTEASKPTAASAFTRSFLEGFLTPAFGSRSKSETDLLVFTALIEAKVSDGGETIAAVNLTSANRSNRFHGDLWVRRDQRVWVGWKNKKQEFAYSHVATSPSGVHMVETYDCGGGSGIFKRLLLFAFDCDQSLDIDSHDSLFVKGRVLLKILGSISLGDRYAGEIRYDDGMLLIGPDEGHFKRGQQASKRIPIR